jgi:histidyl-tRNA synthetase
MIELILLLVIGAIVALLYGKGKKFILKEQEWRVIHHSIDSNIQLYELQNILRRNGIKTRIEMDDSPLTNAVKSYYTDKSNSVKKLLALETDYTKAKQLLDESKLILKDK